MASEERTPDTDELRKQLEESRETIRSLEEQLDGITRSLGSVMELLKTMHPDAYEEYIKKKQNTEEEI